MAETNTKPLKLAKLIYQHKMSRVNHIEIRLSYSKHNYGTS